MGRLKSLAHDLSLHDALLMGGYALYLVFGYLSFESPTVLASLSDQAAPAQSTFLALALCGRIAVYAAVILLNLRRRPAAPPLTAALSAGGTALAGFLLTRFAFDLAAYAPFQKALPWLVVGGLLFGGGNALAALMWARFSGTLGPRKVYLFVLVENLASLPIYFAVTLLPGEAVFPVSAFVFLVSVVLAKLCLDRRANCEQPVVTQLAVSAPHVAFTALWRPTLGTAILFFMSGLMLQLPHNQELSLAQFQSTSLLTQGVVIAALLMPVLLVKRQPHLNSVFKVALPLSATGFLLLPLIWSGAGGIANACAQLGAGVADIILWCMVAALVNETGLSATFVFSCSLLATNTAKLAGTLAGLAFQDHLTRGGVALTTIALAAVYLVAMMSMFLLKERGTGQGGANTVISERGGETPGPECDEDALARRCRALAEEYGLTPREAELLAQLGQGRTLRAISEKLVVSENTVKYHVKAIYQKLGVHSRDEVIDLLGQTEHERGIAKGTETVDARYSNTYKIM